MTGVILQPSYIPWRGYFDQIHRADVFVFYDDVQYDAHGWRNRNRIKTHQGSQWLTIPVLKHDHVAAATAIKDIEIDWRRPWNTTHLASIRQNYSKTPFFKQYFDGLELLYLQHPALLADFTIDLTIALSRLLGIERTRFVRSSTLGATGSRTDRLIEILVEVGATHYVSGPSARSYLDERQLAAAGISLEYMAYDYPEYPQLHPPFDAQVTILDLLFMTGAEAPKFIWPV